MLRSEIITIGDELLIGQVVNTNASWIAKELSTLGIPVGRITTVGDKEKEIIAAAKKAWKENDVVIATGGLGPTHDDISKAAIAKLFGKEMKLHAPTLKFVKERFSRMGYARMPESNIGQALVPEGFRVLPNERGTAPGLLYHEGGKTFIIVAGVPAEMEFVMRTGVLPFLEKNYKGKLEAVQHRTLYTSGIGESSLAEMIGEPKKFLGTNTTLAFLPRAGGVRMRISTSAPTKANAQKEIDRVEAILRERAGRFIFGVAEETIEEYIVRTLTAQHKTLGTAESCTGGLIASTITKVPGSSEVFRGGIVSYHNEVKIAELNVKRETLDKFGAVSEETAREMAEGAVMRLGTDFAVSTTGIAGPSGGTPEKPVGTVWIALAERGKPTVTKLLQGDFGRQMNVERSMAAVLEILRKRLTNYPE